jgi:hypothetical protein
VAGALGSVQLVQQGSDPHSALVPGPQGRSAGRRRHCHAPSGDLGTCSGDGISYRGSAELLRQHAFLYVASVTPYDQPTTRRARLAAALMDVATQEKSNWSKVMDQVPGKG